MNKLRVGIIGLGIGQSHYGGYSASPHAEVAAICDRDEKWLKHCRDAWGTKRAFTKWEDLVAMDELDAVSVCLPTVFHDAVTIAALKAGKHVLCEKPMATDLGSHVVDLAMYITGFPKVKQVVGMAYNKFLPRVLEGLGVDSDADDHSVGFVKFENGMSMQIEASYGSYIEQEKIVQAFYGDKGGAHRESGQPVKLFGQAAGSYTTTIPRIDIPSTTPMAHFVEGIVEGKTPIVTPEQGVAVTRILDGIYESTAEGQA